MDHEPFPCLDLEIADAALRNPAIAHVGLIGSATKRARFEKRLAAAGVATQRIEELICPIGVAGITSKLPAAIALSAAAQLQILDEHLQAKKLFKSANAEASLARGVMR